MAQPMMLLPPKTEEEIGNDLLGALKGARSIDDAGRNKDGFVRRFTRMLMRYPQRIRVRNPRRGKLPICVSAQNRRYGGDMNSRVIQGQKGGGSPSSGERVVIIQNFGPGSAQTAPAQTQGDAIYTPQQFAQAVLVVNTTFEGKVPSWQALRTELIEREIPTTAIQAEALVRELVDSMPAAKKVQAPPPEVVRAGEAGPEEAEESEGFLRFFWGENGPTILTMVLAV